MTSRVAAHWIGGETVSVGAKRESRNPANGEVIGHYVEATAEVVQVAIDAAKKAFRTTAWRSDIHLRARR